MGWKRTPAAGSYEALLATELSAALPLPGLLTASTTQDNSVGTGKAMVYLVAGFVAEPLLSLIPQKAKPTKRRCCINELTRTI